MKKKIMVLIMCVLTALSVAACTPDDEQEPEIEVKGIYVRHILFEFSDEQLEYLSSIIVIRDTPIEEGPLYTNAAQEIMVELENGDLRALFGEGGIYLEIEEALSGLTGSEALEVFEEFITLYNADPGMAVTPEGYYVKFEGETPYVESFTKHSRKLVNESDPESSIGNAFEGNRLSYCITQFGVHIIIIKSIDLA